MKVLVATRETQGWRDNDFCWAVEGELVIFIVMECGSGSIDDGCGCRRSMSGMVSQRATTTVKVVERKELDPSTYLDMVADGLRDRGYITNDLLVIPDVKEWVDDLALELAAIALAFPVGTILERRGETITVREILGEEAAG